MKTAVKIIAGIILLALVIFVFLGATGEKSYDVSRSTVINAPADVIFPMVASLKTQTEWSPWVAKDPEMENEFIGDDGTVGSINKWTGPNSGVGEQEVTKLEPNSRIETALRFKEPYEDQADVYFDFEPQDGGGTKVTWGFTGENTFVQQAMFRLMGIDLDAMIGADYEEGLGNLKAMAENAHMEAEAAKAAAEAAEAEEMEEAILE